MLLSRASYRWSARRPVIACRCRAAPSPSSTVKDVSELLELVAGTARGTQSDAADTKQIMALAARLASAGSSTATTGPELSSTWRLLWTSEKETRFILEKAGLFGTRAGEVYQVIDVAAGSLQNVITFPPEGAFIVDSSLEVEGRQRMRFAFRSSKLKLPSRDVSLPPFGKGWFDTVYLDGQLRISQDSRGDTLIVARDGPPRKFT